MYERFRAHVPILVIVVLLTCFAAKAWTSIAVKSATWDEPKYFGVGVYILEEGRWDVAGTLYHPPLSHYLTALPLLRSPLPQDLFQPLGDARGRVSSQRILSSMWEGADLTRGRRLLSSSSNLGDRLFSRSRGAMLLVAVIGGCFVAAWSHRLYGPGGAMLSTLLFAFSPNLLAHARLITPDALLTTTWLATIYCLWRHLETGRFRHVLTAGIWLGLALLTKFTALLLVPTTLVLALVWRIRQGVLPVRSMLLFFAIGLLVLAAGHGFDPRPYLAGFLVQLGHVTRGHPSFLFGDHSAQGWWYFYPVALLVKTPIPALVLIGFALVRFVRAPDRRLQTHQFFLVVPVVMIFLLFALRPVSIGLRYVLPVYPFLLVLAGQAATAWSGLRRWALLVPLAVWYVAASSWIHPHYLAYFNEFVGGPSAGHKILVDSNLDWGQDLKILKRFMDDRGIDRIYLSYFGTDVPSRFGIEYERLPSCVLDAPPASRAVADEPPRWLAISATNLQGIYFEGRDPFYYLRSLQPEALIGYSILVYDVSQHQPWLRLLREGPVPPLYCGLHWAPGELDSKIPPEKGLILQIPSFPEGAE